MAVADRLMRIEAQSRRLVLNAPCKAAEYLGGYKVRLKAFEEGLAVLDIGESPSLLRDRIAALEEAFAEAVRCTRCGRSLSDPESVKVGVGPDCRQRIEQVTAAVEGRRSTNEESPR